MDRPSDRGGILAGAIRSSAVIGPERFAASRRSRPVAFTTLRKAEGAALVWHQGVGFERASKQSDRLLNLAETTVSESTLARV